MLSDDDLAKIAALVTAIVRDELDRRNVKRSQDLTAAERMRRYRERKANREAAGRDALRQAARLLDK